MVGCIMRRALSLRPTSFSGPLEQENGFSLIVSLEISKED